MANKLVLQIIGDSSQLLKSLGQAQRSINQFVQAAGGAGSAIGGTLNQSLSVFTSLLKGGGAAAGVFTGALIVTAGAGVEMALAAGKQAEQLEQLEAITGINTDTLQDYEVLLNRANLTGQDLVSVMKHVSTSLDQARQGTGTAADRFRQLGIDIRTVTSTDDLIRKVAGASAQFANGAEKAAIMSDLLGKGWATFIKAFGGGTKAMDEATEASVRLGATLSGGQLSELAVMDDHVDDLSLAWTRFSQQLGSLVAPAVDFAARALTNLLAMASNAVKELNTLAGIGTGEDTRKKPPPFVDHAKVLERARSAADAQLKVTESLFKQEAALGQARLQNLDAHLSAAEGLELAADVQMAQNREVALARLADFTQTSFQTEIHNLQQHYAQKAALYGTDEKSQDALAKFSIEHAGKISELMNQSVMAQLASDAAKVTSARKTADLMKQLQLQPYDDAVTAAKTLDDAQRTLYQSEAGMLGASAAARQVRMALIEAEADRTRVLIDQTIADETRKAQAIQNLELETDTKRRQAIQAFPSFFEQQMQAIVASNVFSMGSMVSTWTSGIAQMVVHGGNLQAVWEQTQVAIVQAALNAGIQQLANAALAFAQQQAMMTAAEAAQISGHTAMEATKSTITATSEGIRATASILLSKATGSAMLSTLVAFALATVGVMQGLVTAIAGVFAAMAAALAASIVGAPFAPGMAAAGLAAFKAGTLAVIAGGKIMTGALTTAAGSVLALAPGGIATGPTNALIGEGGSPEAVIPLNSRGAAFVQDAMGGGRGGMMTVVFQVDGREEARRVMKYMPGILYMKTGLA